MADSTAATVDTKLVGRALFYLNGFRLLVAPALLLIVFGPLTETLTDSYQVLLAQASALTYAGASVLFILPGIRRRTTVHEMASFSLATDLLLVGIILHCFGGLESGLVILLLFHVGIAGLLLPTQTTLMFASLVTIGLLVDTWLANGGDFVGSSGAQAALFGVASFVIALSAMMLGNWGRKYQLLAERRGNDLANLERVNELIIHRMRSGVIVVDESGEIRQMNESAQYLLGNPPASERTLKVVAPALQERLEHWRRTGDASDEGLLMQSTQVAVAPRMMDMPGLNRPATLIFLEDTSVVSRRARELAQASLARLSASIAHEIRNPLGALSHAAQLLRESEDLPPMDQKLIRMILDHSSRMNDIVESVLKLSRRERAQVEQVNLVSWIRGIAREFSDYHALPDTNLQLQLPSASIIVMIDSGQLHQAVWNLLENSVKHASIEGQQPVITVRISPIRGQREAALDIIDNGPGIPLEKRSQVFEPFFTTHNQGSGLGLYLAKQLCDANQAPLEYVEIPATGACFRILLRRCEPAQPGNEDVLSRNRVTP
ncbi:MAG: ATP-binding protein [Wenzhouxiangella sp.]|nr:ATP-binding protein [Wenzhouxiangella sp.]